MATNIDQRRPTGTDGPSPPDRKRRMVPAIFVLCLFLPAGTLAWSRGWLFIVVVVAASIVITCICDG